MRNTSTDVEKTNNGCSALTANRKHLHGRGEDSDFSLSSVRSLETPPRTWRRRKGEFTGGYGLGNTSTDVEKTSTVETQGEFLRKHLHGRGEDGYCFRRYD